MLEDRDVGVGVIPEGEKILVGSLCLGLVSRQHKRPAQLQVRQCAYRIADNDPIGALAHLQLGRALALSGDQIKAKMAYQDFLTLWKDADRDIPILQQAKAEYAKLQ